MTLNEINPEFIPWAKIKVIGVWWAGNNAINRMIEDGLEGVEFIAVNTDAQALGNSLVDERKRLNIGLNLTSWLGAGWNPEMGRKAAEEDAETIKMMLQWANMVFITTGMWGGTWTGAAPVIAEIAKSMNILTIGVVTKPFSFEGKQRGEQAIEGINKLRASVDSLIVIPNDKIFNVIDKKTPIKKAFAMIDKILTLGVNGITNLIINPGLINVDYADIKNVMQNSWTALLGIGYGEGENRAKEAAQNALKNPLLETNLDGAKGVIFAVTGWEDLSVYEVEEAARIIESVIDADAKYKWGMSIDPSYGDEVKVTIIATGFQEQAPEKIKKSESSSFMNNIDKPLQKISTNNPWNKFLKEAVQQKEEKQNNDIDRDTPPKTFNAKRLIN